MSFLNNGFLPIVNSSQGGGGGDNTIITTPLDPVEVYKNTRPSDWLPMPTPEDNEMYMLFHIPQNVSSLIAFTAVCTGNYTVEIGTVIDKVFIPDNNLTQNIATSTTYTNELYANNFGNVTSDGFAQCMIKVSGENITKWRPGSHPKRGQDVYCEWNIVEIICKLPRVYELYLGYSLKYAMGRLGLYNLKYFTCLGSNNITDMKRIFNDCANLICVLELDTSKVTDMTAMFQKCCSLIAIPLLDTSKVTDMTDMFWGCHALTTIPKFDMSSIPHAGTMFYACSSLKSIPNLTPSYLDNTLGSCLSLVSIYNLNLTGVSNTSYGFDAVHNLQCLLFDNDINNWSGINLYLGSNCLSYKALINLFNSLPTITETKTLTITRNYGVSELTEEDKAIATNKNWTLTI